MSFHNSTDETYELDAQANDFSEDEGRRIRWERHPEDSTLIVVLDALTGAVIAVVRSLFEITSAH
jgi:hypothetical protein